MGSYGIGPGRCLAAIVEQNHDDFGILWPKALAPYTVGLVIINTKIELQNTTGEDLYQQLLQAGVEVLLDDRDERAGVKFNDMDLIGIPLRITIGKTLEQGKVEVKFRNEKEIQLVDLDQVLPFVKNFLK
jgi:prolyl-tRNA synthetase